MKKLIVFVILCAFPYYMNAQRAAVLEFKAGVGISQNDVDGISSIFTTYFQPSGYTMVERTQIDKAMSEQGFQRSDMTQKQMVRIGEILNVSMIVIGDVNVVMGQYNVDTRVISVESGTIIATEGATFSASSYRESMRNIAQKLAGKIAIKPGQTVSPKQNENDYVDLGLPSGTKWKKTNEKGGFYTYNQALKTFGNKLPSYEQIMELMQFCDWDWKTNGRIISMQGTGPNGNTIEFIPVGVKVLKDIEDGDRYYRAGDVVMVGTLGEYLSKDTFTMQNKTFVHTIHLYYTVDEYADEFKPRDIDPSIMAGSVRLVK